MNQVLKILRKNIYIYFYPHHLENKYQSFWWRCVKQHCVIIHTYIYLSNRNLQIFKLLVRIRKNWPITFAVGVIIQVLPGWLYLYYYPADINHRLCSVLTNNMNLKGPTSCMCVALYNAPSFTSISVCKILIFFLIYILKQCI